LPHHLDLLLGAHGYLGGVLVVYWASWIVHVGWDHCAIVCLAGGGVHVARVRQDLIAVDGLSLEILYWILRAVVLCGVVLLRLGVVLNGWLTLVESVWASVDVDIVLIHASSGLRGPVCLSSHLRGVALLLVLPTDRQATIGSITIWYGTKARAYSTYRMHRCLTTCETQAELVLPDFLRPLGQLPP